VKTFGGPVLFLDRADINTDEIIPAKYLTAIDKKSLAPHLLEDLKLDGFDPLTIGRDGARVIVSRANFGCGSSREHAPWALEVNAITTVVAESYARIFRQNMFNCGMLALELPGASLDLIFAFGKESALTCAVDLPDSRLRFTNTAGKTLDISFTISPFDEALVKAGGWVEFADARY
jgi:3-isopropylmalate/(R)-2-methylmalate dehydratase small subunit